MITDNSREEIASVFQAALLHDKQGQGSQGALLVHHALQKAKNLTEQGAWPYDSNELLDAWSAMRQRFREITGLYVEDNCVYRDKRR